jgi:hypothetical protein
MKRYITFVFFIVIGFYAEAQWLEQTTPDPVSQGNSQLSRFRALLQPGEKLQFSLQTGFSYGTGSFGKGYSTFVAPAFTYKISPKFSIEAGFRFGRGNMIQTYSPWNSDNLISTGNFNSQAVYASGKYKLSKSLNVYGGVYYESIRPDYASDNSSAFRTIEHKASMVGLEYFISEKSKIQIEFRQSNGFNPYQTFYPGPGLEGMQRGRNMEPWGSW